MKDTGLGGRGSGIPGLAQVGGGGGGDWLAGTGSPARPLPAAWQK